MTFTHPSVSTEESFFTRALLVANLQAASDNAMLTCAGNHSGIMAADTPTAKINASLKLKLANKDMSIRNTKRISVPIVSFLDILVISFWSGLDSVFCD
jgi:hypothetical protein